MMTLKRPIHLACALTFSLLGALSIADAETTPIGGAAVSSELTGTVTVVNQERRMLTIETPDGRFEVLHVPDEVQRLDEIKIGNRLTITATDLILVDLRKGADAGAMGVETQSGVVRKPGTKPAGMMFDSVSVTGVVQSVDKAASTLTLMAPEKTMTFKVKDPSVLDAVAPGDSVGATYIRAISGKVTFR
jgi:Cu/Ag efflux protein CusF